MSALTGDGTFRGDHQKGQFCTESGTVLVHQPASMDSVVAVLEQSHVSLGYSSEQRLFCYPETSSVRGNLAWFKSSWGQLGWQKNTDNLTVFKGESFGPALRDKQN